MTKEEFISLVNKERKANKNNWVILQEEVEGKIVGIKSYDLWIQRLEVDNIKDGAHCSSVKQFNEYLNRRI